MDFEFSESQLMFRDMVRGFARQEIAPLVREMDAAADIPPALIAKLQAAGFFGLSIPEEHGGLGVDTITYALVVEELSRVSAAVAILVTVHNSVGFYPLAMFGSEEVKRRFLPRMAAGEIAAFCVTEPGAGSDASALATTARRDGGDWVLDGGKVFVTNGARAAFFVVLARTPGTTDHRSIHAFIVERGTPGLVVGKKEEKLGLRASDTVALTLADVRVPAGHLLGREGDGFKIAMRALDGGRIGVAFQALGIGYACLEEALKYARARVQFGRPNCKIGRAHV